MIRPATFSDMPRLLALLLEMQAKSKYAPDVDVDEAAARSLLMQAIQRHGGTNNGSTLFMVVEVDGVVEAFMVGAIQRVYHIGNRLEAQDMFLYATDAAGARAAHRLIDAYVAWAMDNPKVAKIMLSWTNALGVDGERLEKVYMRKGFARVGGIFERDGQ